MFGNRFTNLTVWVKVLFLVVLCIFIFVNFALPYFWRAVYPLHYKEDVYEAAERYDLDPYLIFSIIRVESKFNPEAVSSRGALGLMQVMPTTGAWAATNVSQQPFYPGDLKDPNTNIHIGSWYLDYLITEFDGNKVAALASYNAGQGNVRKWINGSQWDGSLETVEDIPFSETKQYVEKVLLTYQRYTDIYSK